MSVLSPAVLEPVPADLQPFIATDCPKWTRDPREFVAEPGEDASEHPATAAATWHGAHQLDFGYLRNLPRLRFWRTVRGVRDEITVGLAARGRRRDRFHCRPGSPVQRRNPKAEAIRRHWGYG